MNWYVYMIRCSDASLYTGVTTNVSRRFEEHTKGRKGSKYVQAKIPIRVVYVEEHSSRSTAQKREFALKKMHKVEKERLIQEKRLT